MIRDDMARNETQSLPYQHRPPANAAPKNLGGSATMIIQTPSPLISL